MLAFEPWTVLLPALGLSVVLCFLLMPLAYKIGLLDHPNERKVHHASTPLVGGLAIFIAMAMAIVLGTPYGLGVLPLMTACGLMLITGMLDDLRDLKPLPRFIAQIVACCIMIFSGDVVLSDFGSLMWDGVLYLRWLSVPITIFAALGVINAYNMIDGMDGLSGMVFIVASIALAWLALQTGHATNAGILLIAASAAGGFFLVNARLPWNQRARVFLGDSGTMFMGMFLAWQCIDLGSGENRAIVPMTAVWLLGVPLVDTLRLMTQRWLRGHSSLQADQFHLHHAFLKAGFSVSRTTIMITALVLFTTAIGVAGQVLAWPEYLMFYGYLAFCMVYLYIMHHCWHHGRFLGRDVDVTLGLADIQVQNGGGTPEA